MSETTGDFLLALIFTMIGILIVPRFLFLCAKGVRLGWRHADYEFLRFVIRNDFRPNDFQPPKEKGPTQE